MGCDRIVVIRNRMKETDNYDDRMKVNHSLVFNLIILYKQRSIAQNDPPTREGNGCASYYYNPCLSGTNGLTGKHDDLYNTACQSYL